jgi:hypothetical protein
LRQEHVLPFDDDDDVGAVVIAADLSSPETAEKLQFILNRPVSIVFAERDAITNALARHWDIATDDPPTR